MSYFAIHLTQSVSDAHLQLVWIEMRDLAYVRVCAKHFTAPLMNSGEKCISTDLDLFEYTAILIIMR